MFEIKKVPFDWSGETIMVSIRIHTYVFGDRLAVRLMAKNEFGLTEPFANVTCNLPCNVQLKDNEAFINPDLMEYNIVKFLRNNHLVKKSVESL